MTRVTRYLATVTIATGLAMTPLAASSPAWAARHDGLVNVTIGNVTVVNQIPVAVLNCSNVSVRANVLSALKKIDENGGSTSCKNAGNKTVVFTDN
jgi:hypothetical protein